MDGLNRISVAAGLAAALAAVAMGLSACGQKGPLYLPGVEHPEGGVVRHALPASSVEVAPGPRGANTVPLPASPSSAPTSSTAVTH